MTDSFTSAFGCAEDSITKFTFLVRLGTSSLITHRRRKVKNNGGGWGQTFS